MSDITTDNMRMIARNNPMRESNCQFLRVKGHVMLEGSRSGLSSNPIVRRGQVLESPLGGELDPRQRSLDARQSNCRTASFKEQRGQKRAFFL